MLNWALRFNRKAAQWLTVLGTGLFAVGTVGYILFLFHLHVMFLVDLGIMGLPVIFLGLLFNLIAMILQKIIARRSAASS